jgi:hypothetical protein
VRKRRRKRIAAVERKPLTVPTGPNQSWSMDFVSDGSPRGAPINQFRLVLPLIVSAIQPGLTRTIRIKTGGTGFTLSKRILRLCDAFDILPINGNLFKTLSKKPALGIDIDNAQLAR